MHVLHAAAFPHSCNNSENNFKASRPLKNNLFGENLLQVARKIDRETLTVYSGEK